MRARAGISSLHPSMVERCSMQRARDERKLCVVKEASTTSYSRRAFMGSALAAAAAMGAYRISSASPASKRELLSNGFQEGDNVITIATLGEATSINPFLT